MYQQFLNFIIEKNIKSEKIMKEIQLKLSQSEFHKHEIELFMAQDSYTMEEIKNINLKIEHLINKKKESIEEQVYLELYTRYFDEILYRSLVDKLNSNDYQAYELNQLFSSLSADRQRDLGILLTVYLEAILTDYPNQTLTFLSELNDYPDILKHFSINTSFYRAIKKQIM